MHALTRGGEAGSGARYYSLAIATLHLARLPSRNTTGCPSRSAASWSASIQFNRPLRVASSMCPHDASTSFCLASSFQSVCLRTALTWLGVRLCAIQVFGTPSLRSDSRQDSSTITCVSSSSQCRLYNAVVRPFRTPRHLSGKNIGARIPVPRSGISRRNPSAGGRSACSLLCRCRRTGFRIPHSRREEISGQGHVASDKTCSDLCLVTLG